MVSRKRRRAGLKARETYLRRLAATSPPGFGARLWNTGHPGDMNKSLWKKINAEIIGGRKPRSKGLTREFARARDEHLRLENERLKKLHDLNKEKETQAEAQKKQLETESEKLRKAKVGAIEEADADENGSDVDPDETESEVHPDKIQTKEDPDETESEVDTDETESEIDPDETESEEE
ncbi:hypothetical protein TWF506_011174 [Arthrobotrys conoides]|uniref:Uncharacterized protein n=1 Tax=Arthrobotrys conoides TaxID=74498 RepID=A0AAN8NA78_9PEZI